MAQARYPLPHRCHLERVHPVVDNWSYRKDRRTHFCYDGNCLVLDFLRSMETSYRGQGRQGEADDGHESSCSHDQGTRSWMEIRGKGKTRPLFHPSSTAMLPDTRLDMALPKTISLIDSLLYRPRLSDCLSTWSYGETYGGA